MGADVWLFCMEEIVQKLLHLPNIEAVSGLYGTVAREIGQGAVADHGLIGLLLIV